MIAARIGLALLAAGISLAGCTPRNSDGCVGQQIKKCMAIIAQSATDVEPEETAIDLDKVMEPTPLGTVVGSGKLDYSVRFNDAPDAEVDIMLFASTKTGIVNAIFTAMPLSSEGGLSKDFDTVYRHRIVRLLTGGDCDTRDKTGVDRFFETVVKPKWNAEVDENGKGGIGGVFGIPFCGLHFFYTHRRGRDELYKTPQNPTGAYDDHIVGLKP